VSSSKFQHASWIPLFIYFFSLFFYNNIWQIILQCKIVTSNICDSRVKYVICDFLYYFSKYFLDCVILSILVFFNVTHHSFKNITTLKERWSLFFNFKEIYIKEKENRKGLTVQFSERKKERLFLFRHWMVGVSVTRRSHQVVVCYFLFLQN